MKKDFYNKLDKYAIKIINKVLGFISIFFSKEISEAIDNRRKITCIVINKEFDNACEESIKVKLTID